MHNLFGHHSHNEGSAISSSKTVRIFTRADENFSLSVRNGEVVLAPNDPKDPHQHWYKDMRFSTQIKDEDGFPSFAIVNLATGQAIKHSAGSSHPVKLVPYNPEYPDESVLWTESNEISKGFRSIRMVNNSRLIFDAFHGDKDHGGVRDGTSIVLWDSVGKGENQQWKIVHQSVTLDPEQVRNITPRTVRIYPKAGQGYSLTIRNGTVVLAPSNPQDRYQHWYKDMKFSTQVKDEEGFHSFALVNAATGEAIKHGFGQSHPVRLVPYNPNYLDESVLWTESRDVGNGYRCIRMVNNTKLNFDAFHGDKSHGGVRDGTTVVLWEWCKGDNQMWKIAPY